MKNCQEQVLATKFTYSTNFIAQEKKRIYGKHTIYSIFREIKFDLTLNQLKRGANCKHVHVCGTVMNNFGQYICMMVTVI